MLWIPYLGLSVVLNPTLAKLAPLSSTRATILDFLPSLQGSTDGDHGVTLGMNYEIFYRSVMHESWMEYHISKTSNHEKRLIVI